MPYIERYEGGGRVLMSNGKRIFHRSFLEGMAERFPPDEQPKRGLTDNEYAYLDEIAEDVERLESKIERMEKSANLHRAMRDSAGRTLQNENTRVKFASTEGGEW